MIETHPVQYHAPVYRLLHAGYGLSLTVIYSSDFSVSGYHDTEFGEAVTWDTDLLSGYPSVFLSRVSDGGPRKFEDISARGLRTVLRALGAHVALISGYSPLFNRQAWYEAWKGGYPILFRAETTDHARQRSLIKSAFRDASLRWLYRHSAKLLYIGDRSYRHYRRLDVPEQKLVFSPYCVDDASFKCDEAARAALRPVARQSFAIRETDVIILFSGKLSPRKGPDLLVEAIKGLPQNVRERVVLMFLGSGEMREELERQAQTPTRLKIVFLGFQNQSQLSRFYHAADLLVLPSLHSETWGLVVNEALHHGVPAVVSQAVGCAPDLIEPGVTGEVFETGSVQSLTNAIIKASALIGKPQTRERCREKVDGYSVEKAAYGMARAYHEVVSERVCVGYSV